MLINFTPFLDTLILVLKMKIIKKSKKKIIYPFYKKINITTREHFSRAQKFRSLIYKVSLISFFYCV